MKHFNSYDKGLIDFPKTSFSDQKTKMNDEITDRPFLKETFFSRFFCLFCIGKPKPTMYKKLSKPEMGNFF